MKPTPSAPVATVDAQNPWLGLVSFTEETRSYFHGREEEVAELGRRVQRKLLTVLFGQSGLGKTSILQAGLVPRLRPEGYCPVYVRLDYDPHSPPPAEQIKRAVLRATAAAGTWTRSGTAAQGETLWEFLHHRDDVLKDTAGRTLTPILIFDQFEEIFTLAQSDDAGRTRAQEFIKDLADLVENRPPAVLEARIDRDETNASHFDFARSDYRILISLREDYLAHLEGLKDRMPSVTQNRMRLARMTGTQALSAVQHPAPHLVSEAVAESIVRFVAGGAALAVAEVEPSLLSLICRELNNTRLAHVHAEISADLLAGSRDTILSEFYERALADQPAGVRIFIEDELLTDSGFRESVGEERVRKALAAAGAPDTALAQLVDRRLLRAEDRLDQRRVEITHDVLCSVILASRNVRRERETLAAKERELATQREREVTTRRQLTRARLVAAVAIVLMLAAAGSAVFGWMNLRRARTAEQSATAAEKRAAHVGNLADSARAEAEKIVGFLVDDFYRQLEPTGRVDIVVQLAARAADYYKNLPPEIRTRETARNHGLTLARYGAALNTQNKTDAARDVLSEAIDILEKLRGEGDQSVDTAAGLALALRSQGSLQNNQQLPQESLATYAKAVEVLRRIATASGVSRNVRLDFATAITDYGVQHVRAAADGAVRASPLYSEATPIIEELLVQNPTDVEARAALAIVQIRQSGLANTMGRPEEALEAANASSENFQQVLRENPGYFTAINGLGIVHGYGSHALNALGRLSESLVAARQSEAQYEEYVRLNPTSAQGWSNLAVARERTASRLRALGRYGESGEKYRAALEIERSVPMSSSLANTFARVAANLAILEAETGRTEVVGTMIPEFNRFISRSARDEGQEGITRTAAPDLSNLLGMVVRNKQTEAGGVVVEAKSVLKRWQALTGKDDFSKGWISLMVRISGDTLCSAALRDRQWAEAEQALRSSIASAFETGIHNDFDRLDLAELQVNLAFALARQGRGEEAKATLAPAQQFFQDTLERHHEQQRWVLGAALLNLTRSYLETDPTVRRAALTEADTLIAQTTSEMRKLQSTRELQSWISEARQALPSG